MQKVNPAPEISKKRLLNILTFFDEKRIAKFVARNIFKSNLVTKFYWSYLGIVIASLALSQYLRHTPLLELRFWILAIVGSFLAVLLPIHIIHEILRSKLILNVGLVKINYLWSWKNMMLKVKYMQLDKTTKQDLIRVNLVPFLVFSVLPLIISFFANDYLQLFLLSLAFFHGIYCIKVFALLSFLNRKKKKRENKAKLALNT